MTIFKKSAIAVISLTVMAVGPGCKKKQQDDNEDAPSSPSIFSGGGGVGDGTSLAVVYPGELALAVFTGDDASSLRLADEEVASEATRPIKQRAAEEERIANGQAESCFSPAMARQAPVDSAETCYEFDQDMIYGGRTDRALQGTKNGLNAAGEACLVAYAKNRAAIVNDMLDKAKASVAMMLCQAKKADASVTLPGAVGEQLDLKTVLEAAFRGRAAATIDTALLERLEDDADGNPVFRSTVKLMHDSSTRTVVLAHVPSLTDSETYHGSLTIIHAREGGDGKQTVMTVVYAKTKAEDGSYRMSAELRRAGVHPDLLAGAIGADGQLDFNAHRDFSGDEESPEYGRGKKGDGSYYEHNGDFSGQTLITFQVNPDTDEGAFTYWQNPGSNYNEAARGMVADVAVVDGVRRGCAASGAALDADNIGKGYSIASSIKSGTALTPTGFFHPFMSDQGCTVTTGSDADGSFKTCTKNAAEIKWYVPLIGDAAVADEFVSDQRGGIVTRQCYQFDEASGLYTIDTDAVTEEAGYELFRNTDTSRFVPPPRLDGLIKPLDGGQTKPI